MKRAIPSLFFLFTINTLINAQTLVNSGKPIAEIYTDFHYILNDSTKTSGFGLNRAYFGYNYLPAGNFSGSIIITIGNPNDLVSGSVHRRYAYFREASVTYSKGNLRIAGGITSTRIFDFQQKFWGKRYIANTFQSMNGYGDVADLGVALDYNFNEFWHGDLTVMNGEGYCDIQIDNGVKASAGLTFTPTKQLSLRVYSDIENVQNTQRYTLVGFFGFKNEHITFGAETSYRSNIDLTGGHNGWGISGTGGVNIFKKTELFARYDYASSVVASGENIQWNSVKDGSFAIFGVQQTLSENVKLALDYQGNYPYDKSRLATKTILVNALFKF